MVIRTLMPADLSAVVTLHEKSMQHAAWSESQWHSVLAPRYQNYVVEVQGVIKAVAVFHHLFDELELQTIVVAPCVRQQGLAQQLIESALMAQPLVQKLLLEVSANNHPAIALYRKLGFETTAIRRNYYRHGDGTSDAMLMTKLIERS